MFSFAIVASFISASLLSAALLYPLLKNQEMVNTRIEKLRSAEKERPQILITLKKWQEILGRLGERLRMKPNELKTFQEMTTASGLRRDRVYVIFGMKLLLASVLPVLYIFLYAIPSGNLTQGSTALFVVASAIGGYLVPTIWLSNEAKKRKDEIFHSLPDVLDLLTVCVEAGLGLDAALVKTAENYQSKNNALIKELNQVTLEIRAGKPRAEALKGLAERTMVKDVKAFVAMLVQTEKLGTSLGRTLRTYSDALRIRRKQIAEEKAAKTSVKMLFPLTFCVFPALMVVILVPAFFRIFAVFKK